MLLCTDTVFTLLTLRFNSNYKNPTAIVKHQSQIVEDS